MKILQAFDFLSLPHGGGTVDIVYKLSKALANRGHDVTICTGDHEIDYHYLNGLGDVGIKVFHSRFNKHGFYLMPDIASLDISEYDVIHLHCYRSFQNTILCRTAYKQGIPYIIDAHGSTVARSGIKRPILEAYDWVFGRTTINQAQFVIAETEIGVAEWEKLGADKRKIRIQHPLLDTSEFAVLPEAGAFRSKYHIGSEFMVLFLGRIHRAKGIETLIDAIDILRSRGVSACLVVIGQDDGYKDILLSQVRDRLVSDRVLFTGFLGGVEKLSALVDADVLVQPSRNEAGARPSLEAILCGTPVIVSRDTGAGREIAKFDGGLLFDYGDANSLADTIQSIIDNPDAAKARTERAKVYIEVNLSMDKQIVEYEKLYQEATA